MREQNAEKPSAGYRTDRQATRLIRFTPEETKILELNDNNWAMRWEADPKFTTN